MMRTLTQVPRLMGVIGAVLGILPLAIQKWLVNWWGGTTWQTSSQHAVTKALQQELPM